MIEFVKRYGVPIITGVMLGASYPSMGIWWLAWGALIPLLIATRDASMKDAAAKFLFAGWVCHLMVLSWLGGNVHWAGGWALVGWMGLSLYMAAYWAAIGALWAWVQRNAPWFVAGKIVVGAWVAMEWLQANLLTGFGWSAIAYSQVPFLFATQWASLGGTGLIAAFVVSFNVLIAYVVINEKWRWVPIVAAPVLMLVIVFGGRALYGSTIDSGVRVGIVQPNFPQVMKWDPEFTLQMVDNTANKTRLLLEHAEVDVVVWPEAVAMRDPQRDSNMRDIIAGLAQETETHIILGAVRDTEDGQSYNSSYHVAPDGVFDSEKTYDKNHLAPFGEYIPLEGMIPFLRDVVPAIGDVDHGEGTTIFDTGKVKIGPLICFEVLFPSMAMHYRNEGADALAVVTNLGWFGASAAQGQELEMARFRAIETRLPLIHSANTGISGVFDPYGQFLPVDMWEFPSGEVRQWRDKIAPSQAANFRMFGAFPLAAPADHPLPMGPLWFPRLITLFTVIAVAIAVVQSRKRTPKDE